MRYPPLIIIFALPLIAVDLSYRVMHVQPSGNTVFTYHANLKDAEVPMSGAYDFQFRLFNAPTAGSLVTPFAVAPHDAQRVVTNPLPAIRLQPSSATQTALPAPAPTSSTQH